MRTSRSTTITLRSIALVYLAICLPLTRMVAWLEKKQQRAR